MYALSVEEKMYLLVILIHIIIIYIKMYLLVILIHIIIIYISMIT